MITRLRLESWRAYDRLDLELGPGATFVVASNGTGKTSLIMAAAWGVFGDIAGVRGADEIRGEAEQATVTVDLHLPGTGALQIARTVDRRGRQSVSAKLGNREIESQEELGDVLAAAFGADPGVLAQLTFMIHGGLHETQGEFKLQDHLARLLRVKPLFDAAARAESVAAGAASELRKTKVVERKDARAKDELLAELTSSEQQLADLTTQRLIAVDALNAAAESLRAATEWSAYRGALRERDAKLAGYASVASQLLGHDVAPDRVVDALSEWERDVEREAAEADAEAAGARATSAFIRDAIERLDAADAACPTCLRPFAEHDADNAKHEHAARLAELDATVASATDRSSKQRALLANLRKVLADIRSVPVPVEPASSDPGDASDALRSSHDAARDDVQRLDHDIAIATANRNAIREALDAIEADRETTTRQHELFRLEAIATASAQALRQSAERIMEQQVEPLVAEVSRRWKEMFGRSGLQLGADGRITRSIGARTLPFGALSGGERVWALLVTRLLIAAASTRSPFVWLDEPLEHLDPRLRRVVAGTLAMASGRAGLRQVIVTTYEAPIAQQLMEDVPSASLIYVSSSD